jgi:hypothetical protein
MAVRDTHETAHIFAQSLRRLSGKGLGLLRPRAALFHAGVHDAMRVLSATPRDPRLINGWAPLNRDFARINARHSALNG